MTDAVGQDRARYICTVGASGADATRPQSKPRTRHSGEYSRAFQRPNDVALTEGEKAEAMKPPTARTINTAVSVQAPRRNIQRGNQRPHSPVRPNRVRLASHSSVAITQVGPADGNAPALP